MPIVPNPSAPQVSPNTNPTPSLRVQPAPSLGQSLGQGLEQIGAAAGMTSNELEAHAVRYQQLNNQVAANDKAFAASNVIDQYVNDFRSKNHGMDAVAGLSDAYSKMGEIASKGRDALPLPAQVEYDSYTRRAVAVAMSNLRQYADTERRGAIKGSAQSLIEQSGQTYIGNMNDPNAEAQFKTQLGKGVAMLQEAGVIAGGEDVAKQSLIDHASPVYAAAVKRLYDSGDIAGAQKFYTDHKGMMNLSTQTQIDGTFRVANRANFIEGLAQSFSGGQAPTRAVPTGNWDTGLSTFRADPAAALAQFGIPGAVVTSGARTPEHNDAVHGSPTSEHLTNSAWDFKLPAGMTLAQGASTLADHLHSAGIPFDQIEIDSTNNHLHVGFGEKNRNQVIDQTGKAVGGGGGEKFPPLTLGLSGDPEQYIASYVGRAQSYIEAHPEMPAQDKFQLLQSAERYAKIKAMPVIAQQNANFDHLFSAVEGDHSVDANTLKSKFPGEWNTLRPSQVHRLEGITGAYGNEETPDRLAAYNTLNNMRFSEQETFANEDLSKYDLSRSDYKRLSQIQSHMQADIKSGKTLDNTVKQTLNEPEVTTAMANNNIGRNIDPNGYAQFRGALGAEVEAWMNGPGKGQAPHGKDLSAIVMKLVSQNPRPVGFLGWGQKQPNFAIPADEDQDITKQWRDATGYDPSPEQKYRIYQSGALHGRH